MKKSVKIIIVIAIAVTAAAGYTIYATMPADIETVRIEAVSASEYFIEEGAVKAEKTVDVYSAVSGKIVGVAVNEDDEIAAGEIICTLDSVDYENAIARSRTAIDGYRAQKSDLDEQRRARVSELNANLVGLRSELDNVNAQEADYMAQTADETQTVNDATLKANESIAANNAQIEKQLAQQQIVIDQARATYEQMEKHADDAEILYNGGVISKNNYDAAVNSRDSAESALDAAVAQLEVIRAARLAPSALRDVKTYTEYFDSMKQSLNNRIAIAETQLTEDYTTSIRMYYDALIAGEQTQITALEHSIAECAITSPVAGKLTDVYIKDSKVVNAATPIARIVTERSTDIEVYVSTKDFPDVKLNDSVEITQPASSGDIVFGGIVKEIGTEAVTRVSALGVSERVVKITIEPDIDAGADAALIPGFSFDVKFFTFSADNQLTVPKTALFKYSADKAAGGVTWLNEDMTGKAVTDVDMIFTATSGVVRMREVKLGRELRSDYIIEAGLGAGDIIVKDASADKVKTGARVRYLW